MGDVEEIVRKLSKAQRNPVEYASPNALDGGHPWVFARRNVMSALVAKGLVDAGAGYTPRFAPLSPLGLRIRDHLLSNPSKEGE